MTTPTPQDAATMRTALLELSQPAPHRHPHHPDRGRAQPGCAVQAAPHPQPGGALPPSPQRRLAALTAALHTGLRKLAAVALGGLNTHTYPKDPSS